MSDRDWSIWQDEAPRPAALNMALDEALVGAAASAGVPILRVYRWAEPSVSFGYFDRWESVRERFPERVAVRRWTGGGAVDHAADVTFALAAPRSHPLGQMRALDSYRLIHEFLIEALRRVGIEATLAAACPAASGRGAAPAPCFVAPVCADVLVEGVKVAGGAQRRTRLGLLHQGSLQGPPLAAEVREALRVELARAGGSAFVEGGEIESTAAAWAGARYATAAWLERR